MVKKLEKGSTKACIKPHQEGHKSNSAKVKGKFEEVQSVQNAAVQLKATEVLGCGAVVPHLGRTTKPPKPPRCYFNQRRLSSLALGARRRVTI